MNKFTRRQFLKTSFLTTVSLSCLPGLRKGQAQVLGANGDIRYAVVGFHGRGADHLSGMSKVKGTRLVALCDVDRDVLDKEVTKYRDRGEPVEGYTDIRKLLENRNIDVVTFATPNHWHSLGSIWAIQAESIFSSIFLISSMLIELSIRRMRS